MAVTPPLLPPPVPRTNIETPLTFRGPSPPLGGAAAGTSYPRPCITSAFFDRWPLPYRTCRLRRKVRPPLARRCAPARVLMLTHRPAFPALPLRVPCCPLNSGPLLFTEMRRTARRRRLVSYLQTSATELPRLGSAKTGLDAGAPSSPPLRCRSNDSCGR
jgi:hypothetical protein